MQKKLCLKKHSWDSEFGCTDTVFGLSDFLEKKIESLLTLE